MTPTPLAALTAVLTLAGGGVVAAAPAPTPSPHVLTAPTDFLTSDVTPPSAAALRRQAAGVTCINREATPVRDGQPIVVSLPPAAPFTVGSPTAAFWNDPPVTDPRWRMWFHSLRWVGPLMRRAVEDGQRQAAETLMQQVFAYYRDHPDPGVGAPGWYEGESLRRLESLNCLYRITGDARIAPLMAIEANVLFGPRYYGPPHNPVHNHGLMANLRLVEAGTLVGRADWADRARARLRAESRLAFSPTGTSYEQASAYQVFNILLWESAADALAAIDPADPTVPALRAATARARTVAHWLTEPDGHIVQYGDSVKAVGLPTPTRLPAGELRDDAAGLIIGRDGWAPTWSMYTLRYGPGRWAHGRLDKGAVTWTVVGRRVLIGAGFAGFEDTDPFVSYHTSPASNNVALPDGRAYRPRIGARLRSAHRTGTTRHWVVTDQAHGILHNRTVAVDHPRRTLTVADAFGVRTGATQLFHLSPEWRLEMARRGSTSARFRHPDGRVLRVTTTGRIAGSAKGASDPVAGWTFPTTIDRVPAWELRIRWTRGTVRTTFAVS